MPRFVVWRNQRVKHACGLTDFSGIENPYDLRSGRPLADRFPEDASFSMRPEDPHDMLLTDSLRNTESVIVVSERLKGILDEMEVPELEYLPVTIFDHKHHAVPDKFYIAHPLEPVDCMDLEQSGATFSPLLKTRINHVDRLVIDEGRVPFKRTFFRCLNFNDATLVDRDLARRIAEEGFTGVAWLELEDYCGP